MPTYKLTIAYDGTDFAGWQKQEPPDPAGLGPDRWRPVAPNKMDPELIAGRPGRIALRTVQAVVERAVREVVREPVLVQGASRTDAGVHARCQVAVFRCGEGGPTLRAGSGGVEAHGSESRATVSRATVSRATVSRATGGWPVERGVDRLLRAVNSRLPRDVQVVGVEVVGPGFDPIGDCVAKGYSYSMWVGPHRPLWERRTVWHTWADLDVPAMRDAAACFLGEHDFAAFAAAGHGRVSTVREVFACEVVEGDGGTSTRRHERGDGRRGEGVGGRRDGSHGSESRATESRATERCATVEPGRLVRVEISGNGFLYNMVRIIAGTLHEVGRGRIAAADVPRVIAGRDRSRAGPTLPPEGLCLEWVRYPPAPGA